MTEFYFYRFNNSNVSDFPTKISCFTYTDNTSAKGYYKNKGSRCPKMLPFYHTAKNVEQMGFNQIQIGDINGFYITKDKLVTSEFIEDLCKFISGEKRQILEFFPTSQSISNLGYAFKTGGNGTGYYRNLSCSYQHPEFISSKSLSELGYLFTQLKGVSGYIRVQPVNIDNTDVVRVLFGQRNTHTMPDCFPCPSFQGEVPEYVFKTDGNTLGYFKSSNKTDVDLITLWFNKIITISKSENELKASLQKAKTTIQCCTTQTEQHKKLNDSYKTDLAKSQQCELSLRKEIQDLQHALKNEMNEHKKVIEELKNAKQLIEDMNNEYVQIIDKIESLSTENAMLKQNNVACIKEDMTLMQKELHEVKQMLTKTLNISVQNTPNLIDLD